MAAVAAPFLAPNAPYVQFADRAYAPPMRLHVIGDAGLSAPFVYRQVLEDRVAGASARTWTRRCHCAGSPAAIS